MYFCNFMQIIFISLNLFLFPIEVWGTFKINERFTKDLLNSSSPSYSKYTTGIEIQVSNFYLLHKKSLAEHKFKCFQFSMFI